jgi:hypothetical protein
MSNLVTLEKKSLKRLSPQANTQNEKRNEKDKKRGKSEDNYFIDLNAFR